jgi:hypothetical protein
MRFNMGGEAARSGVWVGAIALLLSLSSQPGAQAQLSGSIQLGQSRTQTTYNNGQIDSRSQAGSVSVGFGPQVTVGGRGRSPYGRLNSGRPPGDGGLGGFGGPGYSAPVFQDPLWTGLIDRNFQIMRRNSPFPDRFAGGLYNPVPFSRPFGPRRYRFSAFGDFAYGGYFFGFGPAVYGSYVPSVYSLYGSWYPPYLPVDHVYIIERQVVGDRPAADSSRPDRVQDEDSRPPSSGEEGDYYLAPRSGETLDDALADIRHAWMNGDFARLKTRLPEKGRVRIYLKGKYKYAVDSGDFDQMTQDAMRRIDTTSFTLDRVKRLTDDRAFAAGKHVYYDPEHEKHEVYVSYGLTKQDGRWRITEAGSSTEPITSHGD